MWCPHSVELELFLVSVVLQVPPELVPGRMVLVITTLLTLTALFNANV